MRKYLPWLVGALALACVLVLATCNVSNVPFLPSALQAVPGPTSQSSGGVTVNGRMRGDPNAKVTLVEFADFQ